MTVALSFTCRKCGALPGASCLDTKGRLVEPHSIRDPSVYNARRAEKRARDAVYSNEFYQRKKQQQGR